MHSLYIIYSKSIDRFYIGESEDAHERLKMHIAHSFKKAFTKAASDWIIVLDLKCNSKSDAVFLERFIKRMKSRVFIEKVIADPEMLRDILKKKR